MKIIISESKLKYTNAPKFKVKFNHSVTREYWSVESILEDIKDLFKNYGAEKSLDNALKEQSEIKSLA